MKLIFQGKTKDVYELQDGNYLLKFKDDATGADGVFDPGANTVGVTIDGMGRAGLRMTEFFFNKIIEQGFPTHFISADINKAEMTVRPARIIGRGVEVICRYRAVGSFIRRYGLYAESGQPLNALVEITLKDDNRGDPLVTKDTLAALGIMTESEYDSLTDLMRAICGIIKDELSKKGLELYDIKLEFGRGDNGFVLIDEISGGCMRVFQNGTAVDPLDLAKFF